MSFKDMLMKVKDAIIRLKIKLFYQSERERETVRSLQIKLKETCCSHFQDHIFILLFFHQSYKDILALALNRFKGREKLLETKCLKKCQFLGFAYTGLII